MSADEHRSRGTFRADRHGQLDEPPTTAGAARARVVGRPAEAHTSSGHHPPMRAPRHLSKHARQWVRSMTEHWNFTEPHAQELLIAAAECLDRARAARDLIHVEGAVVRDRFGAVKEHPAARQERAQKMLFARLVSDLHLEEDPRR